MKWFELTDEEFEDVWEDNKRKFKTTENRLLSKQQQIDLKKRSEERRKAKQNGKTIHKNRS